MSQKNGVSLKKAFSKAAAFGASLLLMTGVVGSASADYNACSYDPYCPVDCCEMPDYVLYADFIYWQVNPEGLEFARNGGIGDAQTAVETRGSIISPKCEFDPGFRVGGVVDLKCSNWDFFAQYTYLCSSSSESLEDDSENPVLVPLIHTVGGMGAINAASGKWNSDLNVLDFGLGRTFEVNRCFDFRPHLGFKATWQNLDFDVRYERLVGEITTVYQTHNRINFDGIGLRGGFDAAWRFSPCFSILGGFAASAVYSDLCITREDFNSPTILNASNNKNLNLRKDICVLVPVMELLLGLRWDSRVCNCYDVFVFVGWENQVWWDLNRFIMVGDSDDNNNIHFGPKGNLTYQGLTLRAGVGF